MVHFRRPFIIINAAMTLDGKIATKTGDSEISCMEDKVELHKLRASTDAVMVGINTVLVDDPRLSVRYVEGKVKRKVIVDTHAKLPLNARLLESEGETVLLCGEQVDEEKVRALEGRSVRVIKCATKEGLIDLLDGLMKLSELGVNKLLVEGGGRLNWSLIRTGLFDELRLSVLTRAIGSEGAKSVFEGPSFERISEGINLKLVSVNVCKCGKTVYLKLEPGD